MIFSCKWQIVGGWGFLHKLCFLCIGCPRKNKPLFVKCFLDDYKLKIIEILYTRGGQYCSYEGAHLKKFWNREPHWLEKQKKKRPTRPQTSCFHHWRSVKTKKKKNYAYANALFFTDIQHGAKQKKSSSAWFTIGVHISVSAHGPHKMVSRAALCPPLLYTVIQVKVYYLHFYVSKKLAAKYASIAKPKIIIQKMFSLCSMWPPYTPTPKQRCFFQKEMLLHLSSIDIMFIRISTALWRHKAHATKRLLDLCSHKFHLILNFWNIIFN